MLFDESRPFQERENFASALTTILRLSRDPIHIKLATFIERWLKEKKRADLHATIEKKLAQQLGTARRELNKLRNDHNKLTEEFQISEENQVSLEVELDAVKKVLAEYEGTVANQFVIPDTE